LSVAADLLERESRSRSCGGGGSNVMTSTVRSVRSR